MSQKHPFSECCTLLNVNPVTFRSWLEEAGIDPEKQVSKADKRIRYLTHEQLEQIALEHGRLLGSHAKGTETSVTPTAFKLLEDRVIETEETLNGVPELLHAMTENFQQQLDEQQQTMQQKHSQYQEQLQTVKASFLTGFEGLEQSVTQSQERLTELRSTQEGYQQHLDATAQAFAKLVQRVSFLEMSTRQIKINVEEIKTMLLEEAQKREQFEQHVLAFLQNTSSTNKKITRGNGTKKGEE